MHCGAHWSPTHTISVLAFLGLLHLISMPWQLMYATSWLAHMSAPFTFFETLIVYLMMGALQLALLLGSHALFVHLWLPRQCASQLDAPTSSRAGPPGAVNRSCARWHGFDYSFSLLASNHSLWIRSMAHPLCKGYFCAEMLPSSIYWMLTGCHYLSAYLWLCTTMGSSVAAGSSLLSMLQSSSWVWSVLLPWALWLGPALTAFWHADNYPATVADMPLPTALHDACRALQGHNCGAGIVAASISIASGLGLSVVYYAVCGLVHLYVHGTWLARCNLMMMYVHRTELILQLAGLKLQLIKIVKHTLACCVLQLTMLIVRLASVLASMEWQLMRLARFLSRAAPGAPGAASSARGTASATNSTCGDSTSHHCAGLLAGVVLRHGAASDSSSGCGAAQPAQDVSSRTEALKAEVQEAMRECIVCQDAPRTIALKPCGHLACCTACFARLQRDASRMRGAAGGRAKCPVCKAEVKGHVAGIIL
jgi:hypothetical protein